MPPDVLMALWIAAGETRRFDSEAVKPRENDRAISSVRRSSKTPRKIERDGQLQLCSDLPRRSLKQWDVGVRQSARCLDDVDCELQPVELVAAGRVDHSSHQKCCRRVRVAVTGAQQVGIGIGKPPRKEA